MAKVLSVLTKTFEQTRICSFVPSWRKAWQAQRNFILLKTQWGGGEGALYSKHFKSSAKLLNVCFQMHCPRDVKGSGSDNPFGRGGIFDGSGGSGSGSGAGGSGYRERRQCFNCKEFGHIARDCPKGDGRRSMKCRRCGGMGHMAHECDGVRKTKTEPQQQA